MENLFRKGTFTMVVVVPMFITWGDFEFTFWLATVHWFSSLVSIYDLRQEFQPNKKVQSVKAESYFSAFHLNPAQIVIITFLLTIVLGTTLLMLPIATKKDVALIDHLFMVTSATCVTGLTTIDLGQCYTVFGQLVILCCIQIGGLGIMTLSSSLTLFLGKSLEIRDQLLMQDILDLNSIEEIYTMIIDIIRTTFIIEMIGAIFLTIIFFNSGMEFSESLYAGIFHSVSAFCNAGLSIFSNNLEGFKTNVGVNLTVSMLIISGGIGFFVIKELRNVFFFRKQKLEQISLHTRVMLVATISLILIGTVSIFVGEFLTTLSQYNLGEKFLISFFQSVTTRTAGFHTISIGMMNPHTLLVICLLMFIGAGPISTAGGIKASTFVILIQSIKATLLGKDRVEIFKRELHPQVVLKSIALTLISFFLVFVVTIIMVKLEENKTILSIIFEVMSAFGTVGLSMGITPQLSEPGKLIIILLMYIGRIGPLTLVLGIVRRKAQRGGISYPQGRVLIG
ncbi:MAG: TrkH family potassium uptake protein [Bacteriovoracaceae bacterium]|nr:TrkH family potassium uptake protein [Bacteriovoracaceae bacterium]